MANWVWAGTDANTFSAGNPLWTDPDNWAGDAVPTIASGDVVTLNPLIFYGAGGGWNISFYATLSGSLVNAGTIELGSTTFTDTFHGAAGPSSFDLLLGGNTTLTGGGTVSMNASGYCTISGPYTLTNVNNIIDGSGYLGGTQGGDLTVAPSNAPINLVNESGGTIEQTGSGGAAALTINGSVTNSGLIEATGSGGLQIDADGTAGIVNQTSGGTLFADGGNITLNAGAVEGGTLEGADGGEVVGGPAGVTLDGTSAAVTIDAGSTVSAGAGSITLLAGAGQTSVIDNGGTLLLATTTTYAPALFVGTRSSSGGLVKLTGGGVISFTYVENPNTVISSSYAAFYTSGTLENVNNTIEGMVGSVALTLTNDAGGTIDFSNANYQPYVASLLTNAGLIEVTGGVGVSLNGSELDQSGGGTLLADGGNIYTGSLDIVGGTLATESGSSIFVQGPNQSNLTLDGTTTAVTIAAGAQLAIAATVSESSIFLAATNGQTGSIVNHGEIVVNNNAEYHSNTLYVGSGAAGGLATVKLSGGGVVDLIGGAIGNGLANGKATLENVDNTIEGSGSFGLRFALVNDAQGVVDANLTGATLSIGTGYATVNNGTLEADGGTLLVDDSVTGAGTALIKDGGTLELDGNFDQSQNPLPGAPAFNENVTFDGAGTLVLQSATTGVASGFTTGDAIDLANVAYAAGEHMALQSTSSGVQTWAVENASGGVLESLEFSGVYADDFTVAQASAGVAITYSVPVEVPDNFTGDGRSDILFEAETPTLPSFGGLASWQIDGFAVTGGGNFGDPGPAWTYEGAGEFYGNGKSDVLWRNQNGELAIWEMSGTSIVGGGAVGNPGGSWNVVGIGDFYGTGGSDILFEDANGNLAEWEMNGISIAAGGTIGNPGPQWTFLGTGDFNGDGKSDLLFEDQATGQYAVWNLDGASTTGGTTLGTLGAPWVFKGVGDFDGSGDSDILFENTTTGMYATWDVSNDRVVGGGNIGAPGADYALAAIGVYSSNGHSDLLFKNVLTGQYSAWDLNDTTIAAGGPVGNPGDDYAIASGLPAASSPVATLVFDNSGDIATWTIADGAISGGGAIGNPGAGWTELAVGDFYGDGQSDILFENTSGEYALWRTSGTSLVGGGNIATPYGWTFEGLGDFNGDGTSDILFENNATGVYATWLMNGNAIIDWGVWGKEPGLTYVATGDFTGDGTSDVLFVDGAGDYYVGFVSNDALSTPIEVGSAAGWAVQGVGDLNGDGKADIVFKNNTTGVYATWDMNGTSIVGGGTIGNPGAQWTFAGVAALNSADHASLVFENAANGQVATWEMNDTTIIGGETLGYASGFTLISAR